MRLFGKIRAAVAAGWVDRRQRGRLRFVPSCGVLRLGRLGVLAAFGGVFLPAGAQSQGTSTVTVSADAESVEEGGSASFTLTRTAPVAAALTVSIEVSSSTGTVFQSGLGAKTVSFAAESATASYSVATSDSAEFQEEAGSTVVSQYVEVEVSASGDSSYQVGDPDSATVKVTDNDEVVQFSLVVPEGGIRIAEDAGAVGLSVRATTVTAGSPIGNIYAVALQTDSTSSAAPGVDYRPLSEILQFLPSHAWNSVTVGGDTRYTTTVTYTVQVVDDAVDEDNETFDLELSVVPGFFSSTSFDVGSAVATIVDDDTAGIAVDPTELTIVEGDSTGASYEVELESEPTGEVTVSVTVPSGAGVSVDETSLRFTAATWNTPKTVVVTAPQDANLMARTVTLGHAGTHSDGRRLRLGVGRQRGRDGCGRRDGVDGRRFRCGGRRSGIPGLAVGRGGFGRGPRLEHDRGHRDVGSGLYGCQFRDVDHHRRRLLSDAVGCDSGGRARGG